MKKSELKQIIKEELEHLLKEDYGGWEQKHELFQITGDELRELVKKIGEKFPFGYIFGTPRQWKKNSVDVSIANLTEKAAKSSQGKQLFKKIAEELSKKSGGKKITYIVKYIPDSYFEPGRMRMPVDYVDVVVTYKII